MPKHKRKHSTGPHGDKYASKPRAEAPRHVEPESEPVQMGRWFRCLHCGWVGDSLSMEKHRDKRRHWQRVEVPAS